MADAILEVIGFHDFAQPHGDSLQIAPAEATVGKETFVHDQVLGDFLLQALVPEGNKATNVDDGVLLGAHGTTIRDPEHLQYNLAHGLVLVVRVARFDKPGVLRETAGIDEERDAVAMVERGGLMDVIHGNGLPRG